MTIPDQNLPVYLQKFTVTAPQATSFKVFYVSVGAITTNNPTRRQWSFTFDGEFYSNYSFEIVFDFSKVEQTSYSITFEGTMKGTLTVNKILYSAENYLTYIPQTKEDFDAKILRFKFKPPCPPRSTNENSTLYFSTNLNDTSCTPESAFCECYPTATECLGY